MKEKRKQKEMERKQAMATPISPLPERELCPYEKLRANIIQEREDAMRESGFFDDLMDMKKDIGLIKEKDDKETDDVEDENEKLKEMRGNVEMELSKKMMIKNVDEIKDKIRENDDPLNKEDLKEKK